jgi:exopolyphosphatase / guanosine-5'-triphosphate,3'-diphosphate pyrophosphatase
MLRYLFKDRRTFLFSLVVLVCCFPGCGHVLPSPENDCLTYRAAFDVGSETTKMKVGRVNRCLQTVERIVYKNEAKVPYAENHRSGAFSPQIRNRGIIALSRLKNEAVKNQAAYFSGAATESFRQASDSLDFLREIKEQTGISIKLIDQDQEAILGYLAATAALPDKLEKTIVWDIGGASMQMIFRKKNREFIIYRGRMASVSFKEKILLQIKRNEPEKHLSPNPIGKENLKKALEIVLAAAGDVPEDIKKIILEPDSVVLGIGGVHNQSVKKQLSQDTAYTKEKLQNALEARLELSDKEIGGNYAATDVSNLILVLGFMEKLGIKEVVPVNVNLADGVLIDPQYW